jgi:hypothetical protein
MTWIQTFTGRVFIPLDPLPAAVDMLDIAHALSNQCRFSGHCLRFYSVAEHSVYVSRVVPPRLARLGLMHDAAEAYLVDVPRPIKPHLEGYKEIESAVEDAIFARFGLEYPGGNLWDILKAADAAVLAAERDQIMGPPPMPWAPLPPPPDGLFIAALPPTLAKQLFLERAVELGLYVWPRP